MTKQELIEALKEIKESQNKFIDQECDHIKADELLLQYINDENITRIFESIDKWYA